MLRAEVQVDSVEANRRIDRNQLRTIGGRSGQQKDVIEEERAQSCGRSVAGGQNQFSAKHQPATRIENPEWLRMRRQRINGKM